VSFLLLFHIIVITYHGIHGAAKFDEVSFIAGGKFLKAKTGEDTFYLDGTGKRADLPEGAKIYDVLIVGDRNVCRVSIGKQIMRRH